MRYATINPYNNQLLAEFPFDTSPDLSLSVTAFETWRKLTIAERGRQLRVVADLLASNKSEYAKLITLEMGKPLREAEYEINKTLTAFSYYIENAQRLLQDEVVESNATQSYVRFEPMGVVFSIMPWNFPFWQVFRFAIPALISGNVTILKHAPNVPQCAFAIQQLFNQPGITQNIFKNYFLTNEDASKVLADNRIVGLTFTGSDTTGSKLAQLAGQHIKKCVMELGGNDAFIVLEDADLDFTIAGAIKSRSINSGQSCNAAKRFIVVESIAPAFVTKLIEGVSKLKVGNPLAEDTQISCLARVDLAEKVRLQIKQSLDKGAVAHYCETADIHTSNFINPVVLTHVVPGMPAFDEEIFGPVWSVVVVRDINEAIETANNSAYGLGASIWTAEPQKAERYVSELQAGNVFINDIVKSDPRLPFGGVKRSGFGRELSQYGLKEFVNVKTVYIH